MSSGWHIAVSKSHPDEIGQYRKSSGWHPAIPIRHPDEILSRTKYYCSHIYHVLYPCWVTCITLLNAVVVKAHGGCWCPNFYFCIWASAFGLTTKAATSESKYCCSHIYHMLYLCLVATLWNADLDKADGGWWCPDGYSVRGHQHPAWWPNPRHINPSSIVSYMPCAIFHWGRVTHKGGKW